MSTARGSDRRGLGGRRHLVLVRGGLDRAGSEDADWQAFCARIGWQHVEAALPDDYEERLAARISPIENACGGGLGVSPIGNGSDEGWPLAGAADPGQIRGRRASLAAATMAVAAVLCVAAAVMLWRAARPPVGAEACRDVEASPRATIAPVDDRAAPVEPSERRRDAEPLSRPPRANDAATPPAPSETKPRQPPAPGALVARRSRRDDTRPRGASRPAGAPVAMGDTAGPPARPARGAEPLPRDRRDDRAESAAPIGADLQAMASGLGLPGAAPRGVALVAPPMIPRAWPTTRASDAWTRPASFGQGVVPASASWSLSPGNPRWYGVGLPPSIASAGVPPGVGVMGQLDVVKALDRL